MVDYRFTDDRAEYEAADKSAQRTEPGVYAAALHITGRVAPMCKRLGALSTKTEQVNVLNPLSALLRLRETKREFHQLSTEHHTLLTDCLQRLAEPIEGAPNSDIAWIQSFTSARGMVGLFRLNQAHASVSEVLDRKAAYAMAVFSLYVALLSFIVSIVLAL